jgi:hypothetical protein
MKLQVNIANHHSGLAIVGKGVGRSRLAMREISALWKRLRARKQSAATRDCPDGDHGTSSNSPELTPSELALDDDSDTEEEISGLAEGEVNETQPSSGSTPLAASDLRGTISLARAANQVQTYLGDWVKQVCS